MAMSLIELLGFTKIMAIIYGLVVKLRLSALYQYFMVAESLRMQKKKIIITRNKGKSNYCLLQRVSHIKA